MRRAERSASDAPVCVNMFTTNADLTDAQVIKGYHDHATCEQFHAELKSDLDFEKVPSGKYLTHVC